MGNVKDIHITDLETQNDHDDRPRRRPVKSGLAASKRSLAGQQGQRRLDRRHGPWLHLLLAPRPCPSRLYDLEQTHVQQILHPPQSLEPSRHAGKADTLARLEREQADFEAFLHRLREAKDKAEFDDFMDERVRKARDDERSSKGRDDDSDDA